MTKYSVKQLSKLAGVSIRTLHHYDKIDLLKPSFRSEKGYRFYEREQLLKLQQILFYKELQFPLQEIREILNDAEFDVVAALNYHRREIEKQYGKMAELLKTIDKTLAEMKNKDNLLTDEEIYHGFDKSEVSSIKEEVSRRWGQDQLEEVENRIRKMGKEGWQNAQQKGEEVNQLLADLMELEPSDINVQKAISLHFRQLNLYYEVSKERYLGLAKMYVEDERFKEHYDKYRPGLAQFIKAGIEVYCENGLEVKD